jgi:uncharacterized protein YodC (DUF2158 family)
MLKLVKTEPAPVQPAGRRRKTFRVGGEVTLISNPEVIMTVERSNPDFTECVWFCELSEPKRETFLTATLRRYVEAKG